MSQIIQVGKYSSHLFGISQISLQEWNDISKLILIVAGSDGKISVKEMEIILDFAEDFAGTFAVLDEMKEFDYLSANMHDYTKKLSNHLKRIVIYAVIMASKADGFDDKEKDKTIQMAESMGLTSNDVIEIEKLFNDEYKLLQRRYEIFNR